MLEQSMPELLLTVECFRLQNFRQRGEEVYCSKNKAGFLKMSEHSRFGKGDECYTEKSASQ